METETKTDNELIAEFMGFTYAYERGHRVYKVPEGEDLKYKAFRLGHTSFKYHTSWDWLMPVVEKIEKLDEAFDTRICFHADEGAYFCDIVDQENNELACQSSYTKSKIEVVYKAVLEFIKWYNNQKENGNRNS